MTCADNGPSDEATKIVVPTDNQQTEPGRTDEPFGGCPKCGQCDEVRNVGRSHWHSCSKHKMTWFVGANLFSSWRWENEEIWERNALDLEAYEVVKPVLPAYRTRVTQENSTQAECQPCPIEGIDAARDTSVVFGAEEGRAHLAEPIADSESGRDVRDVSAPNPPSTKGKANDDTATSAQRQAVLAGYW